jgi:hypothetical protein
MPLNYSRWKHRITYSLSPVTTGADRWVTLILPWRVGIRSDYADIRFSDTAGRALSYNIASKTDGVTATIKINIPTAGTRLIHLYFGNSQAASETTTVGTEDSSPVLTSISGTTNPGYTGKITRVQGGRLNQQGYTASRVSGPYPQWKHKALIKITNSVSVANYQHKLTLSWLPGMWSDFRDIRFTQLNGKKCDYWIESYTSRTSAVVWIEVPTANQRWLNLYYGNGRAGSGSSGANTFDLFDDFPGSTLDTGKWTALGVPGVSGSILTCKSTGDAWVGVYSKTTWGVGYAWRSKLRVQHPNSTSYNESAFWNQERSPYHSSSIYFANLSGTPMALANYNGSSAYSNALSGITANVWAVVELRRKSDRSGITINDSTETTLTSYFSTNSMGVRLSAYKNNGEIDADWVCVRKYSATEPILTLVSHQPNSTRITPYETLGDQPVFGTLYVMDPIEFGMTMSPEVPIVCLSPLVSAGMTMTPAVSMQYQPAAIEVGMTMLVTVLGKLFFDLSLTRMQKISISKAFTDNLWQASIDLHQLLDLDTSVLRNCTYTTTDHNGVSRTLFTGILPGVAPGFEAGNETTRLTGYDHSWYLTQRYVPEDYLHNTATVNPADIVEGLLGGDDWLTETGIEPYSIQTVSEWGDTLTAKVFDFDRTTTRWAAIKKILDYTRYVFVVKWRTSGGVTTPSAYFCHEDLIDTYLDLPAMVTFTKPDPYIQGKITWEVKGAEQYNRVTVYGRDSTGATISYTAESADVTNGDCIPVEYVESSGAFTTAAQVQARAEELLLYYGTTAITYTVVLRDRVDLELLQKVMFSGYDEIPDTEMRIISIKHEISEGAADKKVTIQVTNSTKLSMISRMYRSLNSDATSEAEAIFDAKASQIASNEVGTITDIADDGLTATITLEDGRVVTARVI